MESLTLALGTKQTEQRWQDPATKRAGINGKWLTLIMSDVLATDKQKQERWGGRRWAAQWREERPTHLQFKRKIVHRQQVHVSQPGERMQMK